MYQLYYSPGTASLAVHLSLLEIGAPYQLELIDIPAGVQKSAAYLKLNPNGVVPTLVIDGNAYYECAALLMMLAERHPDKRYAPLPGSPERGTYLQWMLHLANTLQPAFRLWFYPQDAGVPDHEAAIKEAARLKIEAAFARLDGVLATRPEYFFGADISVLDFYAVMLMRWSRNMPKPATEWPHCRALAERVKARPSWKKLYELEGLTEWA